MARKDDRLRARVEFALRNSSVGSEGGEGAAVNPIVFDASPLPGPATKPNKTTPRQAKRDSETTLWEPLIEQLEYWAYNYLRRRDCPPGAETVRLSRALATEAALTLMHAEVPYNTDFEPWVQILVQDVVRRRLRWH